MSVGNKFGKDKKYDISEVKTVKGSYLIKRISSMYREVKV